jgi:hypothetical protein
LKIVLPQELESYCAKEQFSTTLLGAVLEVTVKVALTTFMRDSLRHNRWQSNLCGLQDKEKLV